MERNIGTKVSKLINIINPKKQELIVDKQPGKFAQFHQD